jgi:predicted nuclease with TOPRIM domain
MARGVKVLQRPSSSSSEGESDENLTPSYSKLASIATRQQTAMERIQITLDKSDDLLNDEMERSQALTGDLKSLQSKYDELQSRHVALSTEHEKLSYEFLQRKQDLEKLRASHDDLQKENDSLLAQQISTAQEEFVAPCLKCFERENTNSSAECSNASILQYLQMSMWYQSPHLRRPPVLLTKMLD